MLRPLMLVIVLLMLGDFVFRGIVPSLASGMNDFSDPFVGAWLWRHGGNPYDPSAAIASAKMLTGSTIGTGPIYLPPAFVLVAPLTFLPWGWANFVLAILGTLGVCLAAFSMVRLSGRGIEDDRAWIVAALVFAFLPFHTAIHVGNFSVISSALCVFAVYLASRDRDLEAGSVLAVAMCLKPQLAIWVFAFYAISKRWRLVVSGAVSVAVLSVISFTETGWGSIPRVVADYQSNLQYWFQPGGENDFSVANPLRFQLTNVQVIFGTLLRSATANILAYGFFAGALVLWFWARYRYHLRSGNLAIASLLALSFVPFYHRTYDMGVLILALAWIFGAEMQSVKRVALGLFILLQLPMQSALVRSRAYLSADHSWLWNIAVVPYASWSLLMFGAALLYASVKFDRAGSI